MRRGFGTVVWGDRPHVVASIAWLGERYYFFDEPEGVTLIGRCVRANGHDHPTYVDDTEDDTKEE